ncbi:MAG TPA: regulatory iron-sulfur-containing complex subunit RicT [Gemmatirosa sp.]|nr:regulatory iron-sulfur-containing complex subunit RicT [Gemmatirosa sp.]
MPHLIEIAFKGNRKEFYRWDGDDPPRLRAPIVVDGDRGEDLGHVHATGELALKRFAGVAHGAPLLGAEAAVTRRALRLATPEESARAEELPARDEEARRKAMERVRAHGLQMKVSDAEWQWDRKKLTIHFTAEKRVDFRGLVRDLAALFRARIELKQIGVRDEARRLSGVGRCGREYCSAAWLPELRPVNLNVAKDQRLSLNPTQISGACGRLMCSLRYEHEFYVQQRKRFPKEGKVLQTAKGEEKVIGNDIFRERVILRAYDGETRVVPLAELRAELEGLATGGEPRDPSAGAALATITPAAPMAALVAPVVTDVARDTPLAAAPAQVPDVVEDPGAREASDAVDDGDEDDAERSDDGTSDDAVTGEAGDTGDTGDAGGDGRDGGDPARPRRRRGRRGGRRNRGRPNAAGSSDDPSDGSSDDAPPPASTDS